MAQKYFGDNQEPGNGNTLIVSRDGGGDFLVGVEHRSGGVNHGTHFVRFRRANGGASQHPRVIKALAELELVDSKHRPGPESVRCVLG